MSAEKDPWASLAETLGTSSTPEPSAPQASSPPRQPPKPRGQPKRAAPPASPSNWGSVASDLGLEVRPEVQPTHLPQSSMRPTEVAPPSSQAQAPATVVPPSISSEQGHPDSLTSRPTRNDANQDGFGSESARPPRRFDDQPRRTDSYQREPRREGDEGLPASQEVQQEPRSALDRGARPSDSEGAGRRRSGQRGGRGRGRNRRRETGDGDRRDDQSRDRRSVDSSQSSGLGNGRENDRDRSDYWDAGQEFAGSQQPTNNGNADGRSPADSPSLSSGEIIGESSGSADSGENVRVRDNGGERDAEQPRRRRRRGRRGGRGRATGSREPSQDGRPAGDNVGSYGDSRDSDEHRDAFRDSGDRDDTQPMPTGSGPRSESAHTENDLPREGQSERNSSGTPTRARETQSRSGERSGEPRGRRRRGRGRRDGDERPPRPRTGDVAGSPPPSREQSSRRRSQDSRSSSDRSGGRRSSSRPPRSSSRFSRTTHDEFTPVAGSYDEDDEGLEFLGLEEAASGPILDRDRRPMNEDDVIAESGLHSVLDVPSWVEAIGIVIAGNLDARSRSSRPDDHDKNRPQNRDSAPRRDQPRGDYRDSRGSH